MDCSNGFGSRFLVCLYATIHNVKVMQQTISLSAPRRRSQVVTIDTRAITRRIHTAISAVRAICTPANINLTAGSVAAATALIAGITGHEPTLCVAAPAAAVSLFVIAPLTEKGGAK